MPGGRRIRIAVDHTTLETLEYPAVLKELAASTVTPLGLEKALGLKPSSDINSLEETFKEFSEIRDVIKFSGRLPLGGVADIRALLAKAEPFGAYLLPEELMQVRTNLEASIRLKAIEDSNFKRAYPRTSTKIEAISDQKPLYNELLRIIDDKGWIKDNASPELYHIRKEIRSNKERARSILENLSNDKKFKELLQEDIITIRDDRYVFLIKTGMHTRLDGVIHGRSGSGETYFIEPFQLVELNNKVAILKKEEKAEEIAVLKAATREVLGQRDFILNDLGLLGDLDICQAKALFANALGAVVPVIKKSGEVRIKGARHPLLAVKETKGTSKVVPIDIIITENCNVLVISGANTGGKTVALKTLGLLTLMALSGIPVTAEEGSEVVAFTSIFSDIGDRQDIIASLSTFSAHIKRISGFLDLAGPGSLVLIDEIGTGTDPSEGSAFALAALETFREKGAVTVTTTHLNFLKAHAQADPFYMNASVEFDESTLKPLYILHYGVPGPSLGLSIAESLGIPKEIIERARLHIKGEESAFIESVRVLEEEKEEIRKLKERLARLEEDRNRAVERLRADRAVIVEKAKAKIEGIVKSAKDEIRATINRMQEERVRAVSGAKTAAIVEETGGRVIEKLIPRKREFYIPEAGDKVIISGSNSKGVVLKVDSDAKRAELTVGNIKVWVPWDKLTKRGGTAERPKKAGQAINIDADMETSQSLNIIGMRAEEAIPLVTKFIDNAHANGLGTVEVIHGVGTGRLAKVVEEYLKASKVVKKFYHGDPARGGGGVTIVELA